MTSQRGSDEQRLDAARSRMERWSGSAIDRAMRVVAWTLPRWGIVAFVLVGLGIAVVGTWGAGETYDAVVEADDIAVADRPVLDAMVAARTPAWDAVVTGFTHLGGPIVMPALTLLMIVLVRWRLRSWSAAVALAIGAVGSLAMTLAAKPLIGRARPPLELAVPPYESSAAFPSGHTLNAATVVGLVCYFVVATASKRWVRVLTVVLAVIWIVGMGLSRVYLGHHWLTDVVAGWTLGLAWAAVVAVGHRLWRHRDVVEGNRLVNARIVT